MTTPPYNLIDGQDANLRVQEYERDKLKRFTTFLILGVWLVGAIIHCEIRVTSFSIFQLLFWFCALILILRHEIKRKLTYKQNLAILVELRKQYGENISFERDIKTDADENVVNSAHKPDMVKGFFYFCIIMAGVFGLRYFIDHIWPLFVPNK